MPHRTRFEDVAEPEVGDLAEHISGTLDARPVLRVQAGQVWLKGAGTGSIGPFPASNYTFKRRVLAGTMVVRVRDSDAEAAAWGSGRGGPIIRTVTISDLCQVCGGPRGVPQSSWECDDGDYFSVDRWVNPCGHLDMYRAVLAEARSSRPAEGVTTP